MPRDKASIIICCDTDAGLVSIVPSLRSRNYEVTHVPSVYRAVSLHSSNPADIIIVDANNFAEKEYEVFDIFRESSPDVKLFASIPMTRRDKTPALLRCGVEGYFLEPFYADEILSSVERALRPAAVQQPVDTEDKADKLAALGRFARGMAHQINNPLATLSGWVQIFLSEREETDPQHETLEVMQQEIDRIDKVVKDLLAFSGQPSPQRDQIDINALVRGLVRNKERSGGGKFTTNLADTLPPVYANQAQLRDAVVLLVDYCSSKQSGNGALEISTQADGIGAKVIVKAPAAKVEENAISSLFDPFYSSNGDGAEGGLGLSIPYGVVKGLGGTLTAKRESGRGIAFELTLPAAAEPAKQSS